MKPQQLGFVLVWSQTRHPRRGEARQRWLAATWATVARGLDPKSGISAYWVKLSDDFPEKPIVIQVGPDGGWLMVCAFAYSNRHRTNGKIPLAHLGGLVPGWTKKRMERTFQRLRDADFWEVQRDSSGEHLVIKSFAEWQKTVEQMEAEREARSRIGKKGAAASVAARREQPISNPIGQPIGGPIAQHVPVPVPVPDLQENAYAHSLTRTLVELLEANGNKRLDVIPQSWVDTAAAMYRNERRNPAEAEDLLRWALAGGDGFWKPTITSMMKFRQHYDTIRLQRDRQQRPAMGKLGGATERAAVWHSWAERLKAEKAQHGQPPALLIEPQSDDDVPEYRDADAPLAEEDGA